MPLTASLALLLALSAGATELHVAPGGSDTAPGSAAQPLASLTGARDAIRALRAKGPLAAPVNVLVHAGTYAVTAPLVLGPEDSGSAACPITYAAAGDGPAVFDGGRRITGWARHDDRLWVADLPEVARGEWRFRQLFVDGTPRTLARTPNDGFYTVAGCPEGTPKTVNYHKDCQSFTYAPGDIRPDWTNLTDVEVVVYHFWTDSHLPIASVDPATNLVTFAHKAGKTFTDDFSEKGARYYGENCFEALDQPGEWYLNRVTGRLYYYPLPGEDPNRVALVAPLAPAHLKIEGALAQQRCVEHVTLRGLAFRHARFELPLGNSNDRQGSASVPAAVTLRGARQCAIEDCSFGALGTFAVDLGAGCQGNRFVGNQIRDVSAGGLRVDGGTHGNPPWERTRDNLISDNRIDGYGLDYPSAVGILLMNTEGNQVAHNEITRGRYTGISVGWSWGYGRSIAGHNRIEANHIHHIGGVLSDMGGIYTLGVSPGTVLRGNLIHDIDAHSYGGWGIYLDEGSTHLLIEDNVVHRTKFAGFNIHFAKECTVRNNVFALGRIEQLTRGRGEPHKSVFFEGNIVYWTEGGLYSGNWQDKPYLFRYSAIGDKPERETISSFDCDWNLYYNPKLPLDQVKFAGAGWDDWLKRGKDTHSKYADPLFVAPEAGDFSLKPGSPALALGFRPIDLSGVGPRTQR